MAYYEMITIHSLQFFPANQDVSSIVFFLPLLKQVLLLFTSC
uniref:Uncharacterized protein n=1 Tax=Octopus bimaculoides TaxID=37653 RepID=A0A0L8FMI6_OCTBM